jgi:hypothetical protein
MGNDGTIGINGTNNFSPAVHVSIGVIDTELFPIQGIRVWTGTHGRYYVFPSDKTITMPGFRDLSGTAVFFPQPLAKFFQGCGAITGIFTVITFIPDVIPPQAGVTLIVFCQLGNKVFCRCPVIVIVPAKARDTTYIAIGQELVFTRLNEKAKPYLSYIPPQHFGPPERCYGVYRNDLPAFSINRYGQGRGIYVPWKPGAFFYREGYSNTLWFMQDLVEQICGIKGIAPGLTPMVETTLASRPGRLVVQLVNISGHYGNSYYEPLPVQEYPSPCACYCSGKYSKNSAKRGNTAF